MIFDVLVSVWLYVLLKRNVLSPDLNSSIDSAQTRLYGNKFQSLGPMELNDEFWTMLVLHLFTGSFFDDEE